MEERESFVRFVGDASEFYQKLDDRDEVTGLWEQLLYIAVSNQVDDEIVFEFPTEDDLFKIVFGPPFTLLFKNLLDGTLVVYVIRRPSF